jgi:hypothetical protein
MKTADFALTVFIRYYPFFLWNGGGVLLPEIEFSGPNGDHFNGRGATTFFAPMTLDRFESLPGPAVVADKYFFSHRGPYGLERLFQSPFLKRA